MKTQSTSERDDILEEALDIAPKDLPLFLKGRCGENNDLRQDIERLVAANRRMNDEFLKGTAARWTVPILESGQKLGRYEIEDLIASGGMSIVYRGRDVGIGRMVAIKVLMPTTDVDTKAHSRFLSEVQILGSIRHPNVVQIFDFGDFSGVHYIVMEYLEGKDLAKCNAEGSFGDITLKLDVARQLAAALHHVHLSGIIHRDVKPANIFIEPSGIVKLMDFGISRLNRPEMNQTTSFAGTLEYLPPEQLRGESPSHRSDIYSYGIVLFELFTGLKAYTGSAAEVLYRVAHEEIPLEALRVANIPKSVATLIRSTTRKNPLDRPGSFEEVLSCLADVKDGKSLANLGRFSGRLVKIAAVVLVLCSLAMWVRLATWPNVRMQDGIPVGPPRPSQAQNERDLKARLQGTKPRGASIPLQPTSPTRTEEHPLSILAPPVERANKTPARLVAASQKLAEIDAMLIPAGDRTVTPSAALEIPLSMVPHPAEQVSQPSVSLPLEQVSVLQTVSLEGPKLTKTPDASAIRTRSQVEILDALRNYLAAYNAKNVTGVSEIFPSMSDSTRNKLVSAFSVAKSVELSLTPQGEPLVELLPSGTPQFAEVTCKRVLKMTPFSGRTPKPQIDFCVFRFEYVGGAWKIVRQG